jgi:hypothetical protein
MKAFSLICSAIAVFVSVASAGPEQTSNKEMTAPPPCPSWYADNEWNVGLWGMYAYTANDYPSAANTVFLSGRAFVRNGTGYDTYLDADHVWGGGIDLKYFFKRYFAIGVEGWAGKAQRSVGTVTILPPFPGTLGSRVIIDNKHEDRIVGSVLGTLTIRYPIGCSRFAPYVWVGGGAIFGGGEIDEIVVNDIPAGAFLTAFHRGTETKFVGQAGGGFEVRLTKCIGLTNDFSWNIIDGSDNNFGMARTGINFAF